MHALLIVLVALAVQAVPPAQTPTPARQAFERAEEHFARNENEEALAAYDEAIALDPAHAEYYAGRGRTLARLRRYDETFAAFGEALRLAPGNPQLFRDRGHYYINVRKFGLALADLEQAEALDKDDFGIYYHLALAYYLTGDFTKAAGAYAGCVRTSASDDDRVACYAWQYPSLVRAGRGAEAKALLARVTPALDVKENTPYLDRLLLFKGVRTEAEVVSEMNASPLTQSTVGYGVGLWHLLNGRADLARTYFEKACSGDSWPAFGYVAAEVELERMR
jgi:tetratricopeptide (TPR) repeat protein